MNSDKIDKNQKSSKIKNKTVAQMIWGVALTLAGIGVFFRIPQVMPKIEKIEHFSSAMFFVRFCFYLLSALLVGGGLKKIYENYWKLKDR